MATITKLDPKTLLAKTQDCVILLAKAQDILESLPGLIALSYSNYDQVMQIHVTEEAFEALVGAHQVTELYHSHNHLALTVYLTKGIKLLALKYKTDDEMIHWYFQQKTKEITEASNEETSND